MSAEPHDTEHQPHTPPSRLPIPGRCGSSPAFGRFCASTARCCATIRAFVGALFFVVLFPALYIAIYLGGVWDPASRTQALPVAIVNLDQGVVYRDRSANVGDDIATRLTSRTDFSFQTMTDPNEAQAAVTAGKLAFAVVIPADFSAKAVPGETAGAGRIRIIFSEGNNYSTSSIARRFADGLSTQVNDALNENRWKAVLEAAGESSGSLHELKSGVGQLVDGAVKLDDGTRAFTEASRALSDGMQKLGGGIRQMDAKMPRNKDLDALRSGAKQVADGQDELNNGLGRLGAGAQKLEAGLATMEEKSKSIPFGGSKVSQGAQQLKDGADQLGKGIYSARSGSKKLAAGADQVAGGVSKLTSGVAALSNGVDTMVKALPADAKLAELNDGGAKLSDGSRQLLVGLRALDSAIPQDIAKLGGSADGLASSIEPELVAIAPVATNGGAFSPNMLAVASWVGVVILANMFVFRLVRDDIAGTPRISRLLGKLVIPGFFVVLQNLVLIAVLRYGLGLEPVHMSATIAIALGSSLVFLLLVYALLLVVGDAGKLIAVLLLTLQLTAGGGIVPAELTSPFYRAMHDWLPVHLCD
jgi:putative membrane protein